MAIGTGLALLGSAVIGGVGSAISNKNSNKAVTQAANSQQQVASENNALTRDIYNQNRGILDPYVSRGNQAGGAINALLGLTPEMSGGGGATQQFPGQTNALAGFAGQSPAYGALSPYMMNEQGMMQGDGPQYMTNQQYGQPVPQVGQAPQGTVNALSPYQQAFQNYQNSTGYQFRVGEGLNAINSGYAARGQLQSGAAQKALLAYNQNMASGEFGNYMNLLGGQQNVGLSAGNALAGVGTNYANTVSSNNQNAADALSNSALVRSQNNNAMWSNFGSLAGNALGYSSYGLGR